MNMEGNLYKKHTEEAAEAERLASEIRKKGAELKPEWIDKLAGREDERKKKAEEEIAKRQMASNDEKFGTEEAQSSM